MKRISTLLSVLVAVLMLFAATEVMAGTTDCSPPEKPNSCFITTSGYKVEINEPFPQTTNGNTVFNYKLTGTKTGVTGISHVDMLIPVCAPNAIAINNTSPDTNSTYTGGIGESSTGFGLGDLQDYVLKWNIIYSGLSPRDFQVTITGSKVSAEPTSMLLKLGKVAPEYGVILGPACYAPPLPASQTEQSYTADTPVGPATIKCIFDRLGNLLSCKDVEQNIQLTRVPVGANMECTWTDLDGILHTLSIDYIESGCTMVGSGNSYCITRSVNNELVTICR